MIVVLAADDNYAKYAAVAIASMIENHKGGGSGSILCIEPQHY